MSKKSKNILKAFLLVWLIIILIIIFTPSFGHLYEKIIGKKIHNSFIGSEHPEYLEGFFMAYVFFISLSLTIFGGKNKYYIILVFVGLDLLLFFGFWEGFIIDAGTASIGWLLGEGILKTYKLLKPKK
ncbi:MAG: hypothetical protein WCP18_02275 [bacterium]